MAENPVKHEPRWDIIDKWYNKIDGMLDDMVEEDETPVIEMSIIFMMLQEKLNQQKMGLYIQYVSEQASNQNARDSGLYR